MATTSDVGVHELHDHPTTYLSGYDPVAVSKYDQVIGLYPVEADRNKALPGLEQFGRSVEEILAEMEITEDEFSGRRDLCWSLPE